MGSTAAAVAAATGLLFVAGGSAGTVIANPISDDPYTNTSSQHKTQVEPDSFSFGSTIVAAFQTGRFFDGGASNNAWATSTDGGRHWTNGVLPGTTVYEGGPWLRVSDPAVAYDPEHDVWMISSLAIGQFSDAILTSRSTDGGLTWEDPVTVSETTVSFYDKNWIVCDTWGLSPHFGNCYTQWDDSGSGNLMLMSTSTDGGLTWGPPLTPADNPSGFGGQPVVQPNGTVIVPYSLTNFGSVRSFRSTDGGASWSTTTQVATQTAHDVAGGLRDPPFPSAEVDAEGKVYLVWHDCRFRTGCALNDLVMTTSADGLAWTPVVRIPIDPTTSTVDHFIPGLGVDRTSFGGSAHLGLGYYYYPDGNCDINTCQLIAGFISSIDSGATWSAPQQVTGPMSLSWIAETTQGWMVGDYISTSFAGGGRTRSTRLPKRPRSEVTSSALQRPPSTSPHRLCRSPFPSTAGRPVFRRRTRSIDCGGLNGSREGDARRRGCSRAGDCFGRVCGERHRDSDQQRPVHERVEPAQDAGGGRLVRLREHDRRHVPDGPLLRRRREQHRLVDLDERRPDLDDGRAAGNDDLPGRTVASDQRSGRRLRSRARRVDDLDAGGR